MDNEQIWHSGLSGGKVDGYVDAKPPRWAIERACDLLLAEGSGARSNETVDAFARYIAEHEEAPVDKDVLAVREILEAWQEGQYDGGSAGYDGHCFQSALAAYRRHKGKESGE